MQDKSSSKYLIALSSNLWLLSMLQNEDAYAPMIFEEFAIVMINFKTFL